MDDLNELLVDMSQRTGSAMERAGGALLTGDVELAQQAVQGDDTINRIQYEVEDRVVELMTRYQPLAHDLRFVLGSARITSDLERAADYAKHIATTVIERAPFPAVPEFLHPHFETMARAAARIGDKTTEILTSRDVVKASQLSLDDDELDAAQEAVHDAFADWNYGAQAAVDAALLARFFERYGDHSVKVAHQVVYLVTGEVRLDRS
ncbi:phosphate signaling complex protein PhoU [Haloglycomyces albus]|uniref:phosphate signaling complex protein PhoU n=1 Tax=Haloglycomyces albus TaxID=526067 RepID=UPI0012EC7722|nr:phosphate signaling complex protein PhoU [Haloglycomyces albus]